MAVDIDLAGVVLAGVAAGLAAGVFGVGGGFVLVPALSVAGLPLAHAAGTALGFIAAVAGAAALRQALQGRVDGALSQALAVSAVATAPFAALLSGRLNERVVAGVLAAALLSMAAWTFTVRDVARTRRLKRPEAGAVGGAAGAMSGLTGVSAGLLVTPVLTRHIGASGGVAAGTVAVVSAVTAVAGLAGHAAAGTVRWEYVGWLVPVGWAGALAGARVATRMSEKSLRRALLGVLAVASLRPIALALGMSSA